MKFKMGIREFELGGTYLDPLRDATHLINDPVGLRARMAEDGYLLIRNLHRPEKVQAARQVILTNLAAKALIDRSFPLDDAVLAPGAGGIFFGSDKSVTRAPDFLALVEAPELLQFYERFLDGPVLTYDYKWPRAAHGSGSGAHYDIVHFGRGTPRVYTMWTPLGDVSYEMAPLTILSGSHRWEKVKATYGRADPERDNLSGNFSNDPAELIDRYGGKWLTTEFTMGDALIFGMFTMHASLANSTNRYRISCDTRYQRADEPVDRRHMGETPPGERPGTGTPVSFESMRKQWGI